MKAREWKKIFFIVAGTAFTRGGHYLISRAVIGGTHFPSIFTLSLSSMPDFHLVGEEACWRQSVPVWRTHLIFLWLRLIPLSLRVNSEKY
jgi:hypothetical protein